MCIRDRDEEETAKSEEQKNENDRQKKRVTKLFGERPGPIDNSSIAGSISGSLRMGIAENHSFVLWPETLWHQMYVNIISEASRRFEQL